MKAIDLIKKMVCDASLAEHGDVWTLEDDRLPEGWVESVFGDFELVDGELVPGDYFAVWSCNANDVYPFYLEETSDVILRRRHPEQYDEDDREICLRKIN